MPSQFEEIVTRYAAEDAYTARVLKMGDATAHFAKAVDKADATIKKKKSTGSGRGSFLDDIDKARGGLDEVVGAFSDLQGYAQLALAPIKAIGTAVVAIGAAAAAGTAAFAAFAVQALNAYAEIDSLKRGLTAVSGSAEEAARQFARLRQVAKLPGLGISESIQGSLSLQGAGFSATFAERALMAFGNALASVGKGKDDLFGVILALQQIQSKGIVSAEEINQIAERLPQVRVLMQQAFGTANTEAIQRMGLSAHDFILRLVTEAEKLPLVIGGVQNSLENLGDSGKIAMASAGEAIAENFLPALDRISTMIENMANSGAFKSIADSWSKLFGGGQEDFFVTAASYVFAVMQALPSAIQTAVDVAKDGIKWIGDQVAGILNFIGGVADLFNPAGGGIRNKITDMISSMFDFSGNSEVGRAAQIVLSSIEDAAADFRAMAYQDKTDMPEKVAEALDNAGPMKAIEKHTKATADMMSKQNQLTERILGGGSIGRLGITPVELGQMRRGRMNIAQAIQFFTAAVYQEGQNAVLDNLIMRSRAFSR